MKKVGGILTGLAALMLLVASGCEETAEVKRENERLTQINLAQVQQIRELNSQTDRLAREKQLQQAEIEGLNQQVRLLNESLQSRPVVRQAVIDDAMRQRLEQIADAIGGEILGNRILLPGDFLFPSGSWTVRSSAKQTLRDMADVLAPARFGLMVVGHTDNEPIKKLKRKGVNSNLQLSLLRALSVVEYLRSQSGGNYPEDLVYPAGWGELRPVASNESKQGRARNRRVEIFIDAELSGLQATSAITDVAPAPSGSVAQPSYRPVPAPAPGPAPAPRTSDRTMPRWEK